MPKFRYRAIGRRQREAEQAAEAARVAESSSYRDLQAQAKALDIPANQSAEDLAAAIAAGGQTDD